jgi:NAD(P)-dependent dehydrogenase (short-subunit alcohol dehydrogenase family)
VLAGRNLAKVQECIDELKTEYPDVHYRPLQIDLSRQQSVREAAAEVLSWDDIPSIDFLINSAGVMLLPERTINEDGIEMHFGTNHIGHFLFTCLIMPKLIKAAQGSNKGTTRVVNVSSGSPTMARMRWSDMNFEKKSKDLPIEEQPNYQLHAMWGGTDIENKSYIPLEGYNQSKIANVLFGIAANKRLYEKYGILSSAVHPGVIKTELGRNAASETLEALKAMRDAGRYSYKSLGAGASTSLVAALDPKLADGVGETRNGSENYGAFLADCQISDKAQPLAVSSEEAEKLWQLSERLVKETFTW